MQSCNYNMFIPLEMRDIIQGQKSEIKYEILDIQHTFSVKGKNVIDISLCLKDIETDVESKLAYDYDNWRII